MKIYVVTHEPINIDLPANYELFQVGAAVNGMFCEHNDAVGEDNISVKNSNYCELTAAYWVWKNDHENDIVGLMHYRRFLIRSFFSNADKYLLDSRHIASYLKKYDFIASKKMKMKPSVKAQLLSGAVYEKDFNILRSVIEKIYPDYLCAFDSVFCGEKSYICNILIANKREWDKYYSWLFPIFSEMENYVDMTDYTRQEQRLYGYLSERLFTVYSVKNDLKIKGMRILTYPKISFGKKLLKKIKNFFTNKR